MNIEQRKVTVRQLTKGYVDNQELGVIGFHGLLNIRPPYQRNLYTANYNVRLL